MIYCTFQVTLYSCLITCSKPESSGWVLSSITAAGKIIYLMKTHWLKTDTTYICCIVVLLKANKDRACYVITSPLLGHPTCWLERLNLDQKCRAALFNDTNQGEQSYLNYIQPTFTLIFTSICQSSHCHTKSSPDCHHTRIHNTHPFNKYPRKMKCGRMTLSFH